MKKTKHKHILKQNRNHYLVFQSDASYQQFVICTDFDSDTETWSTGRYFRTIDDALCEFNLSYGEM